MRYNTEIHNRRSIRLKGYDYSQPGAYFITICTNNREHLFGRIDNGTMILNYAGIIAQICWIDISKHFPHAQIDQFVIMPDHVHGIIIIGGAPPQRNPSIKPGTSKTIGSIVRGFKIGTTKWFREYTDIHAPWQRNYYEHIIRDAIELPRIRQYIMNNPKTWEPDAL